MSLSQAEYAEARLGVEEMKNEIESDAATLSHRADELHVQHSRLSTQAQGQKSRVITAVRGLPGLLQDIITSHSLKSADSSSVSTGRYNVMKSQRAELESSLSILHDIKTASEKILASATDGKLEASHLSSEATRMGNYYQEGEGELVDFIKEGDAVVKKVQASQNDCLDAVALHKSSQKFTRAEIEDRDERCEKHRSIARYSLFIPGVNILVSPWSALRARHHMKKADKARAIAAISERSLEQSHLQLMGLVVQEGMANTILDGLCGIKSTVDSVIQICGTVTAAQRKLVDGFGKVALECENLSDCIETMSFEWELGYFTPSRLGSLQGHVGELLRLAEAPDHLASTVKAEIGSIVLPRSTIT